MATDRGIAVGVPVLVVTGPVGAGKTTVAGEVSALLEDAGQPHAFVDVDSLRWCYPAPPGDRFRAGLAMRNLAAVWRNFQEQEARRLVLADVVESRADLQRYRAAVPGAEIVVVRLRAALPTLVARLEARELGAGRDWHVRRAAELAARMEAGAVADAVVETDGRAVVEIARDVLARAAWPLS
ncbi:MAG: AAA family ATPase [Ktedonobacterales bacterium]